jgi:hypothetical protein
MEYQDLEREVLTRLLHAHPSGLGKEILDNYRGEKAVLEVIKQFQQKNFIQGSAGDQQDAAPQYPIKLTSAGVDEAKKLEG